MIISLHVHRLSINLFIEFSSKTNERNTTKNTFFWYLCFITVDIIHSCHNRLKMSRFSLNNNNFSQSDLLAIYVITAFTILKSLEYEYLKRFWSKGDSSHFENSPCFQISRTWSDVVQINENFILQLSAMFTCRDGKDGELSI